MMDKDEAIWLRVSFDFVLNEKKRKRKKLSILITRLLKDIVILSMILDYIN
jgi:hypothetical protein